MDYKAEDIRIWDGLVSDELNDKITAMARGGSLWDYGHLSSTSKDIYPIWHAPFAGWGFEDTNDNEGMFLDNAPQPLIDLWFGLKKTYLSGHILLRSYGNALTFGTEGYSHRDSDDKKNYYTTLYYPGTEWRRDWGGEILFFDDRGEIIKAVVPKPGRVVHFPGSIFHKANSPSRICPELRVSFMFKTQRRY